MYDYYNKKSEKQSLKSKKHIQFGVKIGASLWHSGPSSSRSVFPNSMGTTWEILRKLNSSAHPRPTESETEVFLKLFTSDWDLNPCAETQTQPEPMVPGFRI